MAQLFADRLSGSTRPDFQVPGDSGLSCVNIPTLTAVISRLCRVYL